MIMVIHYDDRKAADIFYDISDAKEKKIVRSMIKNWDLRRCSSEEWFGQDDPNYGIHHWNAVKMR